LRHREQRFGGKLKGIPTELCVHCIHRRQKRVVYARRPGEGGQSGRLLAEREYLLPAIPAALLAAKDQLLPASSGAPAVAPQGFLDEHGMPVFPACSCGVTYGSSLFGVGGLGGPAPQAPWHFAL